MANIIPLPLPTQPMTTIILLFLRVPLYRFHISRLLKCLLFYIWLISLSVMPLKFIYVIKNGRISPFLSINNIQCKYTYTTISLSSSTDGHLKCFHILAIVKGNAAVNKECRYLFGILTPFPLDINPEVKLLDLRYFCF